MQTILKMCNHYGNAGSFLTKAIRWKTKKQNDMKRDELQKKSYWERFKVPPEAEHEHSNFFVRIMWIASVPWTESDVCR